MKKKRQYKTKAYWKKQLDSVLKERNMNVWHEMLDLLPALPPIKRAGILMHMSEFRQPKLKALAVEGGMSQVNVQVNNAIQGNVAHNRGTLRELLEHPETAQALRVLEATLNKIPSLDTQPARSLQLPENTERVPSGPLEGALDIAITDKNTETSPEDTPKKSE